MLPVEEKRNKNSKQKDLILRILRSTRRHPNANWIYEQARRELPNISLGTVYRNLDCLARMGKIREMASGNGLKLYDGDLRNHDHIQCTSCSRVEDIPHLFHPFSFDPIESATGYQIISRRLEFYGTCPECARKSAEV
jgi:Fur family transcriptional regulator, peroxide stress response regulator